MDLEEVVVPLSAEAALADPTQFSIFQIRDVTSEEIDEQCSVEPYHRE